MRNVKLFTKSTKFCFFPDIMLRGAIETKNVANCGKSPRGGGVSAKIKIVYISNVDSLWLRGGLIFFRFFQNSNNWNMTLILMIYETDIDEIYAILGTYMAYIWTRLRPKVFSLRILWNLFWGSNFWYNYFSFVIIF